MTGRGEEAELPCRGLALLLKGGDTFTQLDGIREPRVHVDEVRKEERKVVIPIAKLTASIGVRH